MLSDRSPWRRVYVISGRAMESDETGPAGNRNTPSPVGIHQPPRRSCSVNCDQPQPVSRIRSVAATRTGLKRWPSKQLRPRPYSGMVVAHTSPVGRLDERRNSLRGQTIFRGVGPDQSPCGAEPDEPPLVAANALQLVARQAVGGRQGANRQALGGQRRGDGNCDHCRDDRRPEAQECRHAFSSTSFSGCAEIILSSWRSVSLEGGEAGSRRQTINPLRSALLTASDFEWTCSLS
jgi:hypothetical protein